MTTTEQSHRVGSAVPDRFKFLPVIVFVGGTLLVFLGIYWTPWPGAWTLLAILLAVLFVVFLYRYRPDQRAAMGSVGPAAVGPFATTKFLQSRNSSLVPFLSTETDAIIQLAFFFAAFIGFLVQVFVMVGKKDDESPGMLRQIAVGCAVAVLVVLGFSKELAPAHIPPGPALWFGISAPPLVALTWCRLLLGLWSIILATYPARSSRPQPSEHASL